MAHGRIARGALLIMVAWVLGATPALSASFESLVATRWQWVETTDLITDKPVSRAYVLTTVISNVQLGIAEARLDLTCAGGKASLHIEWSFVVAGKANLKVAYRFSGRPGRQLKARYVNRSRQEVTSLADIRQFLADARLSTELLIRVTSDQHGTTEATFRARAGPDMVRHFVAACPAAAQR